MGQVKTGKITFVEKLMMPRTKLRDRILPDYTRGEEVFNMVSHIVGAAFGVVALVLCVIKPALAGDAWGVVSSSVYGASMIALYTMSSVYHGLRPNLGKKVMQVIDHCTIYFMIAGTYTPVLLAGLRRFYPGWAWTIFGIVWGLSILGCVFTAIDHNKYSFFSMLCYLGIGWIIVVALKPTFTAVGFAALAYIAAGGVAYTIGAALYGLGKKMKRRYVHSIFHLFVLLGSILQFIGIFFYVL